MPKPPNKSNGEAGHTLDLDPRKVEGESQEPGHLNQAPIPGPTPNPGRPGETLPTPVDSAEELFSTTREQPWRHTHQASINLKQHTADSPAVRQAGPRTRTYTTVSEAAGYLIYINNSY